jgi:hypothetical protein
MQGNSIVTAGASDDGEYLSRSTDHLANMASQLADLIGYPVLAYELIQNAEGTNTTLHSRPLALCTVVRSTASTCTSGSPYHQEVAGFAAEQPLQIPRVDRII